LQALRQANVKVWMLTGDKRETAHDIAKTTCLIDHQTIKHEFFPDDSSEVSVGDMTSAFRRKLSAALADAKTRQQQQQQQQQYSVLIGSECVVFSLESAPQFGHNSASSQVHVHSTWP
jgi:magnesium-transporting ATPase (P-type)